MTMKESDRKTVSRRCAWFTNNDSIDSGVMSSTPEGRSSIRRFGVAETSPCHLCDSDIRFLAKYLEPRKLIVNQRLERADVNRPDSR